ncbi:WXG100 family type VII secretion target [Microbacteriaceae bacterium VKM Ac-2855]|nr:WXG100 family type VII secretion target [Microbacteriaceae bacterium VKM Ac-2855]
MPNVNVTYSAMTDAAARLRQGQEQLTTTLSELSALVDNLVSDGFVTDQASGAYNDSFDQFSAGLRQGVEGLEGLAKYLDAAASAYSETDSQLASAIKG